MARRALPRVGDSCLCFPVHGFFTMLELLTSLSSKYTFRDWENHKLEILILGGIDHPGGGSIRRERDTWKEPAAETATGHHGPRHSQNQIRSSLKAGFDPQQHTRNEGVEPITSGASSLFGLFLTSCC